jgi:hypothetical protein
MSTASRLAKLAEGLDSNGVLSAEKGGTGTTSGGAATVVAATAPESPQVGSFWLNSDTGDLHVYAGGSWILIGSSGSTGSSFSGSYNDLTDKPTITAPSALAVSDQANTSTGYFDLPSGTTAQRPVTPQNGMVRMNTTLNCPEWYSEAYSSWFPFSSSGTYTIDFLIVAGGGGGGGRHGGGGGGGGFITAQSVSVTPGTTFTAVIGAGANGAQTDIAGGIGSDSTFFSQIAKGGGGGGSYGGAAYPAGTAGGSGGGAGHAPGTFGISNQPAATIGTAYGFAGGTSGSNEGGGGGGAGGVGVNAVAESYAGAGGPGRVSDITGATLYWAGGGGGAGWENTPGNGGIGGGGGGGAGSFATGSAGGGSALNPGASGVAGYGGAVSGGAGGANTGGGGGGSGQRNHESYTGVGGNGGSGIVVVRYLGTQRGTGGIVSTANGYTTHIFTTSGSFAA